VKHQNEFGNTPLHIAESISSLDPYYASRLRELGANLMVINNEGKTPGQ
jgi:ankyrin repeat protein